MIIPIDKPAGITSHDVVDRVRKASGIKKVGHAGTLDPFATGVLLILVGREATRQSEELMALSKEYTADIRLGYTSSTGDRDGTIEPEDFDRRPPDTDEVSHVVQQFVGDIEQIPPMHSALKVHGKKLYELAREGKEIVREPRSVYIDNIRMERYQYPSLTLRIQCHSGVYIRTLAEDIGDLLGVGAYVEQLERTKVGEYTAEEAYNIDDVYSIAF